MIFSHESDLFIREFFQNGFVEIDLLFQKCGLIRDRILGDFCTLFLRDDTVILAVFVETGYLPPIYFPPFVRFSVKHIRIDPAGQASITCTYHTPGLRTGTTVSLATLVVYAAYLVVLKKKKKL